MRVATQASLRRPVANTSSGFPAYVVERPIENIHFIQTGSRGTVAIGAGASSGEPGFEDASSGDYRPAARSPLRRRLAEPLSPVDARGNERTAPDTVGPLR